MDSQRSRVYNWERAIGIFREEFAIPEDEVATYAAAVWERAGMPAMVSPNIAIIAKAKCGTCRPFGIGRKSLIRIPASQLRRTVILHEIAHAILQQTDALAYHTPQFVSILIELRVRELGENAPELLEMAHRMRVRVEGIPFRKIDHALEAAGPKEVTTHYLTAKQLQAIQADKTYWMRRMAEATGVEKAHIGNRLRGINAKLAKYGCR